MRKLFTSIAVSAVVLLPVSGYGQMGMMRDGHMDLRPMQDCGQMNMSMKRHRFAMMNGIDERYTNKNNPLSPDSQIIASGKNYMSKTVLPVMERQDWVTARRGGV